MIIAGSAYRFRCATSTHAASLEIVAALTLYDLAIFRTGRGAEIVSRSSSALRSVAIRWSSALVMIEL